MAMNDVNGKHVNVCHSLPSKVCDTVQKITDKRFKRPTDRLSNQLIFKGKVARRGGFPRPSDP